MKKIETRIATMTIGVIVALAIVLSQFFYLQHGSVHKKEINTEQHQHENSDAQVYLSTPSTSLPSSSQVELNPHVFFLFEILFEEEAFEIPEFKFSIPSGQFFRTIFGLTISPNAP